MASRFPPVEFDHSVRNVEPDDTQTILVIDDSLGNRETLQELLQMDYSVLLASDGAQGLEMAARLQPDLILLDVLMPGISGYQVLGHLKSDPRTAGIAVIFITGLDRPEDEARSLLMGASDYIAKPFHVPVVYARVALHLRLARHRKQMEALANIDGLTGIANRRQFDDTLAYECRRAQRAGRALSVAMVDVDFFKQYNDCYGHTMGDRALRAVADVLQGNMRRPGDLAARYGGEEFALVMADTALAHSVTMVQDLCGAVRALAIPHAASAAGPYLTISAGVASSEDGGAYAYDADALVRRADECLYQAKAAGRNRTVSVPQPRN